MSPKIVELDNERISSSAKLSLPYLWETQNHYTLRSLRVKQPWNDLLWTKTLYVTKTQFLCIYIINFLVHKLRTFLHLCQEGFHMSLMQDYSTRLKEAYCTRPNQGCWTWLKKSLLHMAKIRLLKVAKKVYCTCLKRRLAHKDKGNCTP